MSPRINIKLYAAIVAIIYFIYQCFAKYLVYEGAIKFAGKYSLFAFGKAAAVM